jgi:hypothetical protein
MFLIKSLIPCCGGIKMLMEERCAVYRSTKSKIVNPIQLPSFGMELINKISIAILIPCCEEFHQDVNDQKHAP